MSSGGDDLVTLAIALLKRGASATQVLEAMGEGGDDGTAQPGRRGRPPGKASPAEPDGPRKRTRAVTHAHVLAALRDAPGPITCSELVRRLPALTVAAGQRHLSRGVEIGSVVQYTKQKPYSYILSKAGRKQASASANITPSEDEGAGGPLKHAQILATVGRLRSATMATIREAHPHATRTAIYQHIARGVLEGALSRSGNGQSTIYSVKASGGKAPEKARGPDALVPRGSRIEEISAALRKAGKPLRSRQIWETYFPKMRIGTVEQHILQGVKKGILIRHGAEKPFTYTVKPLKETKAKALPKGVEKGTLGADRLMSELQKAAGPLRAREIYKLFPDVLSHSVDTCLANRVKDGSVIRLGKQKPYTYQVKRAPAAAPVAKNAGHTNGSPVATA